MTRPLILLALLASLGALSACGDGQPFFDDDDGGGDDGGGDGGGGVGGDPDLPPGTEEPSASAGIFRYEAEDDNGGGYVQTVAYDAATDTFFVDNLAFDGGNTYARGTAIATLGGYAIYDGPAVVLDDVTGTPINQFTYRAIYGVSTNSVTTGGVTEPVSRFAIVRTGSYVDYGFGGFVYERNGGVTLPVTGQAVFTGDYAGMRVFQNRGGLEFTRGDVEIAIDFEDFNAGSGVRGEITNREAFDINGVPIPLGTGDDDLQLPDITFVVGPGTTTENGEISSGLQSQILNDSGALEVYEEGTYYAIVGGDGSEIVGVFVIESDDPRFSGVTAQETGGFIVYR